MDSVRFRQAETTDAQTLWWTKHAAIDGIDTADYTTRELRAWKPDGEAVSDFQRAIESNTFDALIAEVGSETAGYAVLNIDEERIDAVFVHPEYTRRGIATSLVRQLENRARMRDISGLTIVSSLNAVAFYESVGYERDGDKTRTINGVDLPFVVMKKEL